MTELILSLDVLDRKRAVSIAESCAPYIDAIKVGYPLVLSAGLSIVEDLADLALPLIADFKVADIPNTNRLICEAVFAAGFDAVIAHGSWEPMPQEPASRWRTGTAGGRPTSSPR